MIVSQFCCHENGKWYLEVDGEPYLYNAIQSWYPPDRDFRTYIEKAKELGYDIFSLWLYWKEIEPQQGVFDFSVVDEIVQYAQELNMHIEFIWGGTNFCDHLDPRFAPDWVLENTEWLYKAEDGSPKVINGFDMGDCYAIDTENEELFVAEATVLKALYAHLATADPTHRIVLLQLENEININGYAIPKEGVLHYIDRLAGILNEQPYRLAVRVNIAMWKFDAMDAEIDALPNVYAQGIDTYNPHVSYTTKMLTDGNATKFRYVAENGAYDNSTSHILAALCTGAFYNIYRLDYDEVWDRPGAYGSGWKLLPVSLKLINLNAALSKTGSLVTLATPEQMRGFNLKDGMPELFGFDEATLAGRALAFSPRNSSAVGMVICQNGDYYWVADGDAVLFSKQKPSVCESGCMDTQQIWQKEKTAKVEVSGDWFAVNYAAGTCIRMIF